MRTILRAALAAIVLGLLFIAPAQAATPTATATVRPLSSFGLACDFPAPAVNARARVDLTNVNVAPAGSDIDADDIWYRSLKISTNTAATFQPDWVQIQVHSTGAISGWLAWTTRGGGTGDGVTVPASYHWDPSGKTGTPGTFIFDAVRMVARSLGGQQCTTPSRSV